MTIEEHHRLEAQSMLIRGLTDALNAETRRNDRDHAFIFILLILIAFTIVVVTVALT